MTEKTASEKIEEEEIVIDVDEPELTVEDLPGVGPATAEKLREAGFEELLAIAVMSPSELAEQARPRLYGLPPIWGARGPLRLRSGCLDTDVIRTVDQYPLAHTR